MVTSSRDRENYLGADAGAPPPPPPGGYRAAKRVQASAAPVAAPPVPRVRPSRLSIAALASAIVFALVLLIMWAAGATDAIYGMFVLALQLAVLIVVVASLVDTRGRALGSAALALALLVNVGTIGAASAVTRPPSVTLTSPEDDYWAGYPGIKGQYTDEILARTSLEQAQATAEEVLADIRERLSEEYGFTWVAGRGPSTRAERNGFGGESMLVEWTSERWGTAEPISDISLKLDAMATIGEVLEQHGFAPLYSFNDPASGFDPGMLERLYGSDDIRTQPEWEWYSEDYPGPMRFYANITDLTLDDDGSFRAAREAQVAGSDEPIEGLRIGFLVPEVLSEADRDEFVTRMADYPDGG
ncbi:hypothetical protein [Protaetiibacter intestinalis]|uniref:Uncharacterized protein n=1 Tax=Protaetiibacter intestinalis TaxID=2419774 RepID=A0A387B4A7_9MICO|nr:hypothetical protein [Protaetiibacter intestinalis]AYF97147.1 hypothetical protein D7I47_02060 [Protaetiibacter intestinalis]